jgi:L-2,4-diaminobutyrate decarboxylase
MAQQPLLFSGSSFLEIEEDLRWLVEFGRDGLSLDDLRKELAERVEPHFMRYDLPGFQAFFNTRIDDGAALGAEIALRHNQGVTNWNVSPGGATLEELCCRALCVLFGMASTAGATFMYSGTYANQQALYLALHSHAERQGFSLAEKGLCGFPDPARLAVATSRDTHFSVRQAARMLGLGEDRLVYLPVDSNRRIDVNELRRTLGSLKSERDVFCIVANAGTTATGSIDPLADVADVCQDIGAWLHVDSAYGLAYRLVPELASHFAGIERADSICWDPHKQMSVPIPSSLLFLRRAEDFERMPIAAPYFYRREELQMHPGRKSPPSTRPLAALPLLVSLRHLGMNVVIERLRSPLQAVRALAEFLAEQPDFQLCHWPDLGVLCFRVVPPDWPADGLDQLQLFLHERVKAEGKRLISLARLEESWALRVVAISPAVTADVLIETIGALRSFVVQARQQGLSP